MGCVECLAKCVSELLLITINVFLALGGGLVLYVAVFARHTGWVEVISAYWSPINGLATTLIVIGGVIMGMAALGTVAALCRWRAGLCYYMIAVTTILILFLLVAVCSFLLWSMFSGWEDDPYPANGHEESIKSDFDQVYCYAQGVYICNEASVSDALTMFVPDLNETIADLFENMTGGVNTLELILIGINLILALGGALVLYVGIYMRHTGWVEVIKGYWSPIDGIVTALIVIGSLIIALAVLGSIAALCRWRLGLCLYACVVLLVFILFVVVAVAAFILRHTANDWEDTAYPASSDEESVKENFDQAYCYAQGEYICNQASVSDALTMFVPTLDSSIASLFENMTGGVNTLCDSYLGDYDELSDVCDGCDRAREFKNFSSVVNWANDKCPRTSETLTWCGIFLTTGSANSSSGTAPYSECRTEFLNLVEKYSLWLGIGSIIVCAAAIMIITFACVLRRRPAAARDTNSYGRF
ncbi:hypothetical protein BBO99_00000805 [Phytophthora kernoviae]|uniref:Tetraspanin n=1 Tax=Phytophthora kernoviae TaxID=325452 RepID=A0A3R7JC03_9STRA|nr:hypothetical protein JM18_004588 [Phytophthora kernoviae]RLN46824.1 hypothetical protein BBI17_000630 [Phytophthora kernoviae]RLN85135.1 hypothetical protein BBO99_00000805 [Phytophthora kernoviae]